MKALIGAVVVIILMIGAQSAFALTPFESGYRHGISDAKIDTTNSSIPLYYIHQPGQGFANHTTAFVDGYIKGWCSHIGPRGGGGIDVNDAPEPTIAAFDCDKGLSSATPDPMDWPAISEAK